MKIGIISLDLLFKFKISLSQYIVSIDKLLPKQIELLLSMANRNQFDVLCIIIWWDVCPAGWRLAIISLPGSRSMNFIFHEIRFHVPIIYHQPTYSCNQKSPSENFLNLLTRRPEGAIDRHVYFHSILPQGRVP